MKVLITGAQGQVGRALTRRLPSGMEVISLSHAELDICNERMAASAVNAFKPDVLINAAAYTAVDRAEADEELAQRVNEQGARNLAVAAARTGARLIHMSTDYVFDGESSRAYSPDQPTRPLGVYGRTKLAGENAVFATLPGRSVVLRTAWVYGVEGHNFVRTMLRLMTERGEVRVVADQIGTPTAAESIAEVIWRIVGQQALQGIFHWTDAGVASWYDFAVAIAEEAAHLGKLSGEIRITPITTDEYPTRARRPRFSLLDSRKTVAAIGVPTVHWRVWLRRVLGEMSFA